MWYQPTFFTFYSIYQGAIKRRSTATRHRDFQGGTGRKRAGWRGKRRRKEGRSQEEEEKIAIEEVMIMGTVQIFNIGYVQSRGTLGQISALQGAKSLYGFSNL